MISFYQNFKQLNRMNEMKVYLSAKNKKIDSWIESGKLKYQFIIDFLIMNAE